MAPNSPPGIRSIPPGLLAKVELAKQKVAADTSRSNTNEKRLKLDDSASKEPADHRSAPAAVLDDMNTVISGFKEDLGKMKLLLTRVDPQTWRSWRTRRLNSPNSFEI